VKTLLALLSCFILFTASASQSGDSGLTAEVNAVYPDVEKLYLDLHQTPELSTLEANTSAKMAAALRAAGYAVTTKIGGYGVVGVLRNGSGPVVMLRTDMDALPVEEQTGLPYASKVRMRDITGDDVPVMHACGHDIHMASWVGTARIMAATRDRWSGTLIMVGQPAEERVIGAAAMLKDGLYTRFPKPDIAVATHDDAWVPAGIVAVIPGYLLANADSVNITIHGRGAHGSAPHASVDPIVIAARSILGFQALVAREKDPQEPGVVTVGAIHGGTKNNIIPDTVQLQLSVRSFTDQVRDQLLNGIARIVKAEAASAGAPREPEVAVIESTHATYNDPDLARRLRAVLVSALGGQNVIDGQPVMGSEDFSEFVRAGVPGFFLRVGAVPPAKYDEAKGDKTKLPSLHSARFAPDREPTLKTTIVSEVAVLRELLKKKS
jgi:hippurate hydrolase